MIFLSVSQILREINFGDCKSAKSALLTHLGALNFDFHVFLQFLKTEMCQINKIQSSKNGKKGIFRSSKSSKIDFT